MARPSGSLIEPNAVAAPEYCDTNSRSALWSGYRNNDDRVARFALIALGTFRAGHSG